MVLNERQRLFCAEYMKNGGNGAEAARKAGYAKSRSKQTAYWLMQQTEIINEINRISAACDRDRKIAGNEPGDNISEPVVVYESIGGSGYGRAPTNQIGFWRAR